MSGHSKWNNIKRKKEKTDGAKAKVFTKIGREISVAVRTGGPNPASNSKLADLIQSGLDQAAGAVFFVDLLKLKHTVCLSGLRGRCRGRAGGNFSVSHFIRRM